MREVIVIEDYKIWLILNGLDKFLNKIKFENKNIVIRFTYDPNYDGQSDLEPSLSMIIEHIKQLSKIINKHLDTLTALEAGMLGPWGEIHRSKITTNENKVLVFKYWLENTKDIPVLGRTPIALLTYFNKSLDEMKKYKINKDYEGYRLGLFNDCFLSSDDDSRTYTINRTREINWQSFQNQNLPFGGENANYMIEVMLLFVSLKCVFYIYLILIKNIIKKFIKNRKI